MSSGSEVINSPKYLEAGKQFSIPGGTGGSLDITVLNLNDKDAATYTVVSDGSHTEYSNGSGGTKSITIPHHYSAITIANTSATSPIEVSWNT
ncbi:MAG: hypothetical protein R8G66_15905 [Cytophagales bacterium]|nr:hypothetical protein [Cytophagales bacterium]